MLSDGLAPNILLSRLRTLNRGLFNATNTGENIDSSFKAWCSSSPELAMWGGFGIITAIFLMLLRFLVKQTWKKAE